MAHNCFPGFNANFAWEIGVYHGLRAKHFQSYLGIRIPFQSKTKSTIRNENIAFGHEIQSNDLQYVGGG